MAMHGVTDYTNRHLADTTKNQEAAKALETGKGSGNSSTSDYISSLNKQVPYMSLEAGSSLPMAKDNKVNLLTINPKLLLKMKNSPEKEKEYVQRLKDIERAQKWLDNYMKSRGYTTKISHWYVDENGKASHLGYHVREDNLSPRLREERRKNAEKLIEKIKEQSAEKTKELEEALEEKAEAKANETKAAHRAEKLINDKMSVSKDGTICLSDPEIAAVIEAVKDKDRNKAGQNTVQTSAGIYLDMKI